MPIKPENKARYPANWSAIVAEWFQAKTAPEAYLQQELRRLHSAIEGEAK